MKAVILAGGLGSRLSEETHLKPKPMVEIGQRPILWHIMKIFSVHGVNEFVICLGYKGYLIKEFFANYALHNSDVTIDISSGEMAVHRAAVEPWKVTLVDTGEHSQTAGRLRRVRPYLENESEFLLTYGDGVGNVDISALLASHQDAGRMVTVTAVQPPGRFGGMALDGNQVRKFDEKPAGDGNWINGGFFVMRPDVIDLIENDTQALEIATLPQVARMGQLSAYKHHGFWQPMDTLRDKVMLEGLWSSGEAPWKIWSDQ